MVLTIKNKFGLYRKFEYDIWGLGFTNTKNYKLLNKLKKENRYQYKRFIINIKTLNRYWYFFFKLDRLKFKKWKRTRYVYRLDEAPPVFVKRHVFKVNFVSVRLARLYFITIMIANLEDYLEKL